MERKYELDDLPGEIRADIKGYEWLYQVSNMWRVKRMWWTTIQSNWHVCKYKKKISRIRNTRWQAEVCLRKDNIEKPYTLWRLVVLHFMWLCDEDIKDKFILKYDWDWLNCAVKNLYLIDKKEMANHYLEWYSNERISDENREKTREYKDKYKFIIKWTDKEYKKSKECSRGYYEKNKDKFKEYRNKYNEKNKEKRIKYYNDNKDKILLKRKEHYIKNREDVLSNAKEYYKNKVK